ncbi:MAG: metal-dependent hydrolase [Planctomycetota bacterium]|jgi:membrane-bound metal-dependent hydrolase YbcI (DUF457 family)|nr:metal-dependent hydrolase [Planctomycetota bacterium]
MDTVTHALLGAGMADCWFRRRLGPVAAPLALIAAAAPDLDMIAYFVSPETAWATHRGYSHSLLALALAGPAFGSLGWLFAKRAGPWILWTLLAWLCLFSHTFLDLATSWGTMPLLPFSNARISWDILPIVDVFMSSVLLTSFIANRLLRRERVETFLNPLAYPVTHKHPGRRSAADRVAAVAVILAAAYFCVGWLQNRQTVRIAREALAASGFPAVEVRALPIMFTFIAYDIVARDADGVIRKAHYSSWAPKAPVFAEFPAPKGGLAETALNTVQGRLFSWHAQGMVGALPPRAEGEGWRLTLVDRRFSAPTDIARPGWAMDFVFDRNRRVVSAAAERIRFPAAALGDELKAWWFLTRYGDARGLDAGSG